MDQEKFGAFIKNIRKEHNLTQKQLADKYNVTYQAVSKWENGKNMPDMALIKKISSDFNVSIEELLEGEYKENKNKRNYVLIVVLVLLVVALIIFLIYFLASKDEDFQFKTLSSSCDNFTLSGNVSYNKNKSAIYITNIKYCGGDDNNKYKSLECVLYESSDNIEKKISSYYYDDKDAITLEDFLQKVTLSIDDYEKTCREYTSNSLYLIINAKEQNDKTITYKIPLTLEACSASD